MKNKVAPLGKPLRSVSPSFRDTAYMGAADEGTTPSYYIELKRRQARVNILGSSSTIR